MSIEIGIDLLAEKKLRRPTCLTGKAKGTGYFFGLDIFWLRDESLEESDSLPVPDIFAQEIADDLEGHSNNSAKSRWIGIVKELHPKRADPEVVLTQVNGIG